MTGDPIGDAAVLNALFANSPQGLFVFDSEQKVTRYNPAGRGVRGLSDEDVLGQGIADFAPGFEADELQGLIDEVQATGEALRGRLVRGKSPTDPHRALAVEVSLFPLHDLGGGRPGLVGVVEDVTERQAAADRLAVLSEVHATVGSTLDVRTTGDELVRALVPAFADAATVDLLDDGVVAAERAAGPPPTEVPLRRVAFAPPSAEVSRREGDSRPLPFPTPYTQVLNDMRARLVRVSSDDPWLSTDPEGFEPLVRTGVHSMIVAPLLARDTVLGLLTLYRHRTEPFEEADLDVARQAAFTASVHLDNAHSYRREHTVAAALQRRLQPGAIPLLSAVETAHVYLPESAGGDWFDVVPLSGTRVALVVGDVTGHGIEAAATMGQLRLALRTLTLRDLETDELLTHLDEVASQLANASGPGPNRPVATCAVTVYNPVSRHCTMVRAGHPAPVVIDPDGVPRAVEVPQGPPLGTGGGHVFTPAVLELAPGTLLALHTNGLTRGDGDQGDAARRRLEHILASTTRPLQELCDTAVYHMAPSRHDDAVLLLARTRVLPPEHVADWTLPADASVVGTARRLVDRQLAAWNLDEAVYTTELVVSELVTNAIRYGKGPVRLRLIRDRGRLLTEVTDANSASPHLRRARENDEGGRGLFIVMRLSTHWGVRHSRHAKTIWSEQRLDGGPPDTSDLLDAFDVPDTAGL
ncbi:SpoIIE family protein phosphatase [Streptomyces sp. RK23]|uniref:SpoIIE family protein phosphatase n=1 Tax=unclassified Streptomyces TaxID=2593676 RepID=UPI001B35CCD9|nr:MULTISPECIES: SpoIIE family protein phosphatase [unclassified Streptomyces]MBQ0966228.1 SpoIIE family protein phosphatase [Streptomyces sp. RK74B]MBQ1006031.1 SpoIIE family protein phosphatase [Streptomyces sp. RK23]